VVPLELSLEKQMPTKNKKAGRKMATGKPGES
jgi:hypothetical protein